MKDNQVKTIKLYLEMHRKISSWDAITKFRITRLASVIHILRNEHGMNIESVRREGGGKNWVDYIYHHKNKDGQFSLL